MTTKNMIAEKAIDVFRTIHVHRGEIKDPRLLRDFAETLYRELGLKDISAFAFLQEIERRKIVLAIVRGSDEGKRILASSTPAREAYFFLKDETDHIFGVLEKNPSTINPEEWEVVLQKVLTFARTVIDGLSWGHQTTRAV